jgi:hypothetical protein
MESLSIYLSLFFVIYNCLARLWGGTLRDPRRRRRRPCLYYKYQIWVLFYVMCLFGSCYVDCFDLIWYAIEDDFFGIMVLGWRLKGIRLGGGWGCPHTHTYLYVTFLLEGIETFNLRRTVWLLPLLTVLFTIETVFLMFLCHFWRAVACAFFHTPFWMRNVVRERGSG